MWWEGKGGSYGELQVDSASPMMRIRWVSDLDAVVDFMAFVDLEIIDSALRLGLVRVLVLSKMMDGLPGVGIRSTMAFFISQPWVFKWVVLVKTHFDISLVHLRVFTLAICLPLTEVSFEFASGSSSGDSPFLLVAV